MANREDSGLFRFEASSSKKVPEKIGESYPLLIVVNWFNKNYIFAQLCIAQSGKLPSVHCTKWHSALLCNHNLPQASILHNCAITKWQVAKLCNHKIGNVQFCDCASLYLVCVAKYIEAF